MDRMTLDQLYATMPTIVCQRKCQRACGPILMGEKEWDRILLALPAIASEPVGDPSTLTCPLLTMSGDCSVYQVRPMICRLWGLIDVPGMRCPHGCRPSRWVSHDEAGRLLMAAAPPGAPLAGPWPADVVLPLTAELRRHRRDHGAL